MSNLADELHTSSQKGQNLASQTAKSMDEINTKVEAISEAISIIDQISFQTNILSLNAAVEAAIIPRGPISPMNTRSDGSTGVFHKATATENGRTSAPIISAVSSSIGH